MQHEAILILNTTSVRDEFNVTVNSDEDMQRLCRIVSYYYLVEAIDNDSNVYYYMKQNAMDALAYWVISFTSSSLLYIAPSFDAVGSYKIEYGSYTCGIQLAISVFTNVS